MSQMIQEAITTIRSEGFGIKEGMEVSHHITRFLTIMTDEVRIGSDRR